MAVRASVCLLASMAIGFALAKSSSSSSDSLSVSSWKSVSSSTSSSFTLPSFLSEAEIPSSFLSGLKTNQKQCIADLEVANDLATLSDGEAFPLMCHDVKNLCGACASCKNSDFVTGTAALSTTQKNCVCLSASATGPLTGSDFGDCLISVVTQTGGAVDFNGGDGDDCVLISAGGGQIDTGKGNDHIFLLQDGVHDNVLVAGVVAGEGDDCIFLGADVDAGGAFAVMADAGNDIILAPSSREDNTAAAAGAGAETIDAGEGNDLVLLFGNNLAYQANVLGGEGSDVLRILDAAVQTVNNINPDVQGDDILLKGVHAYGNHIYGNDQADKIVVKDFAYAQFVRAYDGKNDIEVVDGAIVYHIYAGAGDDYLLVSDAQVQSLIDLMEGNDEVVLEGDQRGANVVNINLGAGRDALYAYANVKGQNIDFGDDNDYAYVAHGARFVNLLGKDGNDEFKINGEIELVVDGGAGADSVDVGIEGSVLYRIIGGADDDIIEVSGRAVSVFGDDIADAVAGNDVIKIHSEAVIHQNVLGGMGADEISVSGVVGYAVLGGDGADDIVISSDASVPYVQGGADIDVIDVSSSASVKIVKQDP